MTKEQVENAGAIELREYIAELLSRNDSLKTVLDNKAKTIEELKRRNADQADAIRGLQGEIPKIGADLREEVQRCHKTIDEIREARDSLQEIINELRSQLRLKEDAAQHKNGLIADLEKKLVESGECLQSRSSRRFEQRSEILALEENIERLTSSRRHVIAEREGLRESLADSEKRCDELKSRLGGLAAAPGVSEAYAPRPRGPEGATIPGKIPPDDDNETRAWDQPEVNIEEVDTGAEAHVDWFLKTIRPLLVTHYEHGYKHGLEVFEALDHE